MAVGGLTDKKELADLTPKKDNALNTTIPDGVQNIGDEIIKRVKQG